jgi:hypothetical protein
VLNNSEYCIPEKPRTQDPRALGQSEIIGESSLPFAAATAFWKKASSSDGCDTVKCHPTPGANVPTPMGAPNSAATVASPMAGAERLPELPANTLAASLAGPIAGQDECCCQSSTSPPR